MYIKNLGVIMSFGITFFVGLLLTFGAVGGIEQAPPESNLVNETVIAFLGLAMMYVSTLMLKDNK